MMRYTSNLSFGLLILSLALCSATVLAQSKEVKIITCEDIAVADTTSQEAIPVRQSSQFHLTGGEENISFVLRFFPFTDFTSLRLIITKDTAEGEYITARKVEVSPTDTTAATTVIINKPGNYFVKVVKNYDESAVLGRSSFAVSAEALKAWDYLPFLLMGVLLITLSLTERFKPRTFISFRRWYSRPILLTTFLTFLVLTIAVWMERGGHNFLQHSNLIGILGLIGIIGTIIGVILTYEQLKLAEDRIEGYEKFYDVLHEILCDPKAQFLQFYGTTILPGQVAFGDEAFLKQYILDLNTITTHFRGNHERVCMIVPSVEQYKEAYKPYIGVTYRNKVYDEQTIESKVKEALEVQDSFKPRADIIEIHKNEEIGVIDAFYFSNGKTAVYAVPLHYNVARVEGLEHNHSSHDPKPILIGFKTTNSSIVTAFKVHFDQLRLKIKPSDRNPTQTDPKPT